MEKTVVNFNGIYKGATWRVGTKEDPKKEYGIVSLCFIVPKSDGESFVKDVDEFVFDKADLPVGKELMDEVVVQYEINPYNPVAKLRFVKVL